MSFLTTEEVADLLDMKPQEIYETRRRREFPGVVGVQRGKRLMFDSEAISAGPDAVDETTDDVNVAIVWALGGIERKLGEIVKELRAQRPQWITGTLETVIEEETEWVIGEEEE